MYGLGTIINVTAIFAGGILGIFFGQYLKESARDTIIKATGVCTLFLGISGALSKSFHISGDGTIATRGSMMLIISIIAGGVLGELVDLDRRVEQFGFFIREHTGNSKDKQFVNAFVTSSLTVCVGAMAIVGAISDGISGDYSTLAAKAVLDFLIILVMSAALGKGCMFSAIPVGILQGAVTLLARWAAPVMTDRVLSNLSLVGSVLIFMVGINLIWPKTIKIANLLPSLIVAMLCAAVQ